MKKEDLQERLFHLENGIVKTIYKMKTCKYGCGKMKVGGKVTAVKKMAKSGPGECPPGKCPISVGGKKVGCGPCGAGLIAGLVSSIGGSAAVAGKMIADASKKRKAVSEIKKANPGITRKEARKKLNEPTEEKKLGGAKKKYAMGGATLPMMGMPMYSSNPRSEQGRILKKGGSTTNRAVSPGCRGGMVKDASGKCVSERPRFKKGGFPDLNKDGKVTRADILKGRGVIKKMGGAKKR
jgi:hypothetical protein